MSFTRLAELEPPISISRIHWIQLIQKTSAVLHVRMPSLSPPTGFLFEAFPWRGSDQARYLRSSHPATPPFPPPAGYQHWAALPRGFSQTNPSLPALPG